MENPVVAALVISLLGMPLLFLALAFFYGMLTLLATAIREWEVEPAPEIVVEAPRDEVERLAQRAAAVAVVLARAEMEMGSDASGQEAGDREVGPWWALHHQRQLLSRSMTRRVQ